MQRSRLLAGALLLALHAPAGFAHRVLACEPEWAALAREVGGALVTAQSATTGRQDPHHIEPRPSIIAKARSADLLICTGMGVEEGWLPLVLRQSGNGKIQPGELGYLQAGDYVEKLDVPRVLDRAEGDVHAEGNHHIQGDPRNILILSRVIAQRLSRIDPTHRAEFEARQKAFSERWTRAMKRWQEEAAPLKGAGFVEHHKAWTYLARWLGLREIATLEPKPGVQPTIAHLQQLVALLERDQARFVVRAPYNNPQAAEWLGERTHLPVLVLPTTIGGDDAANDLFSLFDDIVGKLVAAAL